MHATGVLYIIKQILSVLIFFKIASMNIGFNLMLYEKIKLSKFFWSASMHLNAKK